jgi:hypothetical protein
MNKDSSQGHAEQALFAGAGVAPLPWTVSG